MIHPPCKTFKLAPGKTFHPNFVGPKAGWNHSSYAQCVRFASPQLAPTTPATTVSIALSSVGLFIVLCVCCPKVQFRGKVPSSFLPCTRSAVACRAMGVRTFNQSYAYWTGRTACRAVPLLSRGGGRGAGWNQSDHSSGCKQQMWVATTILIILCTSIWEEQKNPHMCGCQQYFSVLPDKAQSGS